MKKIGLILIVVFVVSLMVISCGAPAAQEAAASDGAAAESGGETVDVSDELYIVVGNQNADGFFVNHDFRGLMAARDELGVKVQIVGPSENNLDAMKEAFEQAIAMNPAGIMTNGWDTSLTSLIDKAVDSGIPVVIYDANIVDCKKSSYVGTDWSELGTKLGNALVEQTGGQGQIAVTGLIGADNMDEAYAAIQAVVAENPGMEVVGYENDENSEEVAATKVAALIQAYPGLTGVATICPNAGAGAGRAIQEANKVGDVKLVMNNAELAQLQLIKDGVAQYAVAQKRELFCYYALHALYDINHSEVTFSMDDEAMGFTHVPLYYNTGLVEVSGDNIDEMIEFAEWLQKENAAIMKDAGL